jgi:hypothetical protein
MTDIPDDIMKAAQKIATDWAGAGPFTHDVAADIAVALLAAEKRGEQRERERCAEACDAIGDREDGLAMFYLASDAITPIFRCGERIAMELATAIRNGDPR